MEINTYIQQGINVSVLEPCISARAQWAPTFLHP